MAERAITAKQFAAIIGVSMSNFWMLRRKGTVGEGFHPFEGSRNRRWLESEAEALQKAAIAAGAPETDRQIAQNRKTSKKTPVSVSTSPA